MKKKVESRNAEEHLILYIHNVKHEQHDYEQ